MDQEIIYGNEEEYTKENIDDLIDQRFIEEEDDTEEKIDIDQFLLGKEKDEDSFSEKEENQKDLIKEIDIGGDILKRYQFSIKTETPIEFVETEKGKIISLKNLLKGKEDTIELLKNLKDKYGVSLTNFIMLYYMANIKKPVNYIINNINKLEPELIENKEQLEKIKERYIQRLIYTEKKYQVLTNFYSKLNDIPLFYDIESVNKTLAPNTTEKVLKAKLGQYKLDSDISYYVFDLLKNDSEIIYIEHELEEDINYKIYELIEFDDIEFIINEKKNSLEDKETEIEVITKNEIFMVMKTKRLEKYIYSIIVFDFIEETISIKYSNISIDYIKNKLKRNLVNIKFLSEKTVSVSGSFSITFPGYDNFKMYYLTLFNDVVGKFMYIKEEGQPRSLKTNLKYYFKNPLTELTSSIDYSLSFYINSQYANNYEVCFKSKILNQDSLSEFVLIFSKIISFYLDYKFEEDTRFANIEKMYNLGLDQYQTQTRQLKNSKKIDSLLEKAPEMFPKNTYSKKCNCPKQPIIIAEEDAEDWDLEEDLQGETRKALMFPPENSKQKSKKYTFVCPSMEYSQLYFIQNKGENSQYPILPCCTNNKAGVDLKEYYNYDLLRDNPSIFLDKKLDEKTKTGTKLKIFNKRANNNQKGYLNDVFDNFMKGFFDVEYIRYGVAKNSKSSFLHCLFLACHHIDDLAKKTKISFIKTISKARKIYLSKDNFSDREIFVNNLRSGVDKESGKGESFFVRLEPNFYEICNQEMYNFDKQLTREILENERVLLDSKLFYKLFEKIFLVNIFVFELYNDIVTLEKPNHDLYHMREINPSLPSLVLLRHKEDGLVDVYEIIKFDTGKKIKDLFLFPPEMAIKMKTYIEDNGYFTFEKANNKIIARKNSYLNINWNYILSEHHIESQGINSQGRIYKITIRIYNGNLMTLFVPPSFPLNVKSSNYVIQSTLEECTAVFGKKYLLGKGGVWYKINDCQKSLFIPCKDVEGEENPCNNYELITNYLKKEKLERIKIIEKNTNVIKQLIFWLWCLSDIENIEGWIDRYLVIDNNYDKLQVYHEKKINIDSLFPQDIVSTDQGIEYLSNFVSEIFNDYRIKLYRQFYDSIKQFMLNYINFLKGIDKKNIINSGIIHKFQDYDDFKKYPYTNLILGSRKFGIWLDTQKIKNKELYTISESDISITLPFNYYSPQNQIFLVQNNSSNSLKISLLNNKLWYLRKKNLGFSFKLYTFWQTMVEENLMEDFEYNEEGIIDYAISKTYDENIETFEEAISSLLTKKVVFPVNVENYSYRLHSSDTVDTRNIKNGLFCCDIWVYGNGGYASMLKLI